jgi:hypothetical protein
MTKEEHYRRNAAETIQMAQRASSISDKGRLLRLAEAWLNLADRAHITSRNLWRHPLMQTNESLYPD